MRCFTGSLEALENPWLTTIALEVLQHGHSTSDLTNALKSVSSFKWSLNFVCKFSSWSTWNSIESFWIRSCWHKSPRSNIFCNAKHNSLRLYKKIWIPHLFFLISPSNCSITPSKSFQSKISNCPILVAHSIPHVCNDLILFLYAIAQKDHHWAKSIYLISPRISIHNDPTSSNPYLGFESTSIMAFH